MVLCGISNRFRLLSPASRQIAHALLTRSPLSLSLSFFRRKSSKTASFDLHVLSTPPAFVLSQDQTLSKNFLSALLLYYLWLRTDRGSAFQASFVMRYFTKKASRGTIFSYQRTPQWRRLIYNTKFQRLCQHFSRLFIKIIFA